jgi:hypothetical protein
MIYYYYDKKISLKLRNIFIILGNLIFINFCLSNFPFINYNSTNKNDYNEYTKRESDKDKTRKYYYIEKNKEEIEKKNV